MNTYEVPADPPAATRRSSVWPGADMDNIRMCLLTLDYIRLLAEHFGDCDDPEFYHRAIAESLARVDHEIDRECKLITAATMGGMFAEAAYPNAV